MAAEGGEELPDREAMSLVNANIAIPVNAAVAANVLSDKTVYRRYTTTTVPLSRATTQTTVSSSSGGSSCPQCGDDVTPV